MPNHSTFPTLYDESLQLSITKLKQWGYLDSGPMKIGTVSWGRNGNQAGSITIKVNTYSELPYLELDYKFQDVPRNYKVGLVSIPSNLGKGEIWYFLCPRTNKRCRKLYLISGYFYHREAFSGCIYESQTWSKKYREMDRTYETIFRTERLYEQLYSKHFKMTYAGKPTKRYLRITSLIQKAESIPTSEWSKLI